MLCVRHIEDADGNLVEVPYYRCALCYRGEADPEIAAIEGGWWPCLDTELESPEPCRICGELIGGARGEDVIPDARIEMLPATVHARVHAGTDGRDRS